MNDDLEKNDGLDDLEAQLASLGIFGDDDDGDVTDIFAGLNLDDDDDPLAGLEALGKPPAEKTTPMITLDDLDDLDNIEGLDLGGDFNEPEPSVVLDKPEVTADDLGLGDLGDFG
ncbi:MAG: hypothetical protein LBI27_09150, partial [Clostridiales bacterium]|nr:hypothetical protein [Clostridiales bacterium]